MRLVTFVKRSLKHTDLDIVEVERIADAVRITVGTNAADGVPLDALVNLKKALGADRLSLRGEVFMLVGGHGSSRLTDGSVPAKTAVIVTTTFTPERRAEIENLP